MNLRFDAVRDSVLRAHPWNFAVKRQTLAQRSTAPAFEFDHAYALPSDFLRLLRFNREVRPHYQIEGNSILTDADSAELIYVARITDPTLYDPLFIEALAARLAHDALAMITGDERVTQRRELWDEYITKLKEARSVDGMENPPLVLPFDYFTDAHLGAHSDPFFRPIEDA